MRGLKMKVVDSATGATLSLTAATKRLIALGYPLTLLHSSRPSRRSAGVAEFALLLFLFFTAITNERRQGLHDKWANSLVIRSTTSGDGATLVGCLVLIVLVGRLRDRPLRGPVRGRRAADGGTHPRDAECTALAVTRST